ncbi:hypothetical protein Tco_1440745 [Tanacetum coccineum]
MYYPRFTKAIIHHFITKDKSILMRNRMFMHTARDDIILGTMRFVSKSEDFQVYGALLPSRMTNRQMQESNAYKTYLAYATGAASPKIKRKLKKPASPSKKRTIVTVEEEEPEPAKKVVPTKKPATKDSLLVFKSETLLALKRSKRETTIHQVGGSSEGADSESEVPDKPKGKSIDTSKGTGLKPGVLDVSKGDSFECEYESWGDSGIEDQGDDERTESDDEPTETDNPKIKYERTNEELYGDVNVSLTDAEPADEYKGNKEMTNTETEDAEHENVIQESAGNQVKDDAQETHKTEGPILSSSISSDYAAKYFNFDNIPPVDTEVVSIIVDLEKDVKELKDVDKSTKVILTIQSEVPKVVKEYLGSSLDDAMNKVVQKNVADIIKEHSVPVETIERLKQQYAPQKSVEDIREIKMEHARKQQVPKSFNKSPKQRALYHALMESILEDEDAMDEGVAEKLKKRKPDDADKDEGPFARLNRGLKRQKISKDIEPSKKAKSTETSKGTSKSQPKSTGNYANQERPPTPDPEWNKGRSAENKPIQKWLSDLAKAKKPSRKFDDLMSTPITNQLDWNNPEADIYPFDLSKPLPLVMSGNHQIVLVDYFFNNYLAYLQRGSTDKTYTTSLTKTKASKYDLPRIEDMVPNLWSPEKVAYDSHALLGTSQWEQTLNLKGDVIMHLAATLRMFIRRIMIKKIVEDLLLGVESNQKKLNNSRPMTHKAGITDLKPYSTFSNPQGFIYVDKLGRNRLMCSHELYKFSNNTLISLCDTLKDMANNLEMGYTSVMPRRRWSSLDKKRSYLMIKDIDHQLLGRRLMRSLEKFVGGREYEEDL